MVDDEAAGVELRSAEEGGYRYYSIDRRQARVALGL